MSTVADPPKTLTAEEYWALPDDGRRTELVRGKVVAMTNPGFRHGEICGNIYFILRQFVQAKRLGRIISNDTGVVTERDPDTVRGPDVMYYSFERVPASQSPKGYAAQSPELAFEVKSPSDRWNALVVKAGELLNAGVLAVCIVDPDRQKAQIHRPDEPVQVLNRDDLVEFPEILPGFTVRLSEFFDAAV